MAVERREEIGKRPAKVGFTFKERYSYRVVRHMTANKRGYLENTVDVLQFQANCEDPNQTGWVEK